MAADDSGPRRFEILGRIAGWDQNLTNSAQLWLDNFDDRDRPTASALLDTFVYIDSKSVDAMFSSAFGSLASVICRTHDYAQATSDWRKFMGSVLVTIPTGERPNPTDSGYSFQRMTRQIMEIDESQIVEPAEAIRRLSQSGGHVVFVDDIVGSGDQFLRTWRRQYRFDNSTRSFADISANITAHYVPLLATQSGVDQIGVDVPDLNIMPVHVLGPEHSANRPESLAWANLDHREGRRLVQQYSQRIGIASAWGYEDLALCIAFQHGVPDATIPLFYKNTSDWRALVQRR